MRQIRYILRHPILFLSFPSFLSSIEWVFTGEEEFPYKAKVSTTELKIRFNGNLPGRRFTLLKEGVEKVEFKDFPSSWTVKQNCRIQRIDEWIFSSSPEKLDPSPFIFPSNLPSPHPRNFKFSEITAIPFDFHASKDLRKLIGPLKFDELLLGGFANSAHNLDLYLMYIDNWIYVFSAGEKQPGRNVVILEYLIECLSQN